MDLFELGWKKLIEVAGKEPTIATVINLGEGDDGFPFAVWEYVSGGSVVRDEIPFFADGEVREGDKFLFDHGKRIPFVVTLNR